MENKTIDFQRFQFRLHEIIFEADTVAGKWFDILLIVSIVACICVEMLDSVDAVSKNCSVLRVLRVFFVFKLVHFMGVAKTLVRALRASRRKIIVFMMTVVTQACPECMAQDHDADALFCKKCPALLNIDVS